jgi:hypothetical protein
MKKLLFVIFVSLFSNVVVSQVNFDSLVYIHLIPSEFIKNGKSKPTNQDFIFHISHGGVYCFNGINTKYTTYVDSVKFTQEEVLIYSKKTKFFKRTIVYSVPLKSDGTFYLIKNGKKVSCTNYTLDVCFHSDINK